MTKKSYSVGNQNTIFVLVGGSSKIGLEKSALTGHWPRLPISAAWPVEAVIGAWCSIFAD